MAILDPPSGDGWSSIFSGDGRGEVHRPFFHPPRDPGRPANDRPLMLGRYGKLSGVCISSSFVLHTPSEAALPGSQERLRRDSRWTRKQEVAAMMGDTTISDETRDKVRKLCAEAGLPDKMPELESEEAAPAYIEHLEAHMQQQAPDKL